VNPDLLNLDPDPAFVVNPDPDPTRVQGFHDQKLKEKNTSEHFYISFIDQKSQFTYAHAKGEACIFFLYKQFTDDQAA
jgi:hypothetical protein